MTPATVGRAVARMTMRFTPPPIKSNGPEAEASEKPAPEARTLEMRKLAPPMATAVNSSRVVQ
ncbi:MAG TPA: hypothetical protein PKU97_20730, partial [Kofleriaceae bacterium]|nr:hypothetical protein [Kofleriaceae bacterium]